jgi:metal transporter CNNM
MPVVRDDMPLYEIINMFQLGMSRIAVVVAAPAKEHLVPLSTTAKNRNVLPRSRIPLWSTARGMDTRESIDMRAINVHVSWTTDFLEAAQKGLELPDDHKQNVFGIGAPSPIGIVTFEDVIGVLLQKTSRDEKDFFSRAVFMPPTKTGKGEDHSSASSGRSVIHTPRTQSVYTKNAITDFQRTEANNGVLRRRNVSSTAPNHAQVDGEYIHQTFGAFDGADDRSFIRMTGDTTNTTLRSVASNSSYTQNSHGGFHVVTDTSSEEINIDSRISSYSDPALTTTTRTASLPVSSTGSALEITPLRNIRRVAPFSRQTYSSFGKSMGKQRLRDPLAHIIASGSNKENRSESAKENVCHVEDTVFHAHKSTDQGIIASWDPPGDDTGILASTDPIFASPSRDTVPLVTPSTGSKNQYPLTSMYSARSMPRLKRPRRDNLDRRSTQPRESSISSIPERERSFHDDRSLLPSQRVLEESMGQDRGPMEMRRTSLWF